MIRVIVFARIRPEDCRGFETAFVEVQRRMSGTPGLVRDELLEDETERGRYLLIGEWATKEAFLTWEDDSSHRETSAPMGPFWRDAEVERRIFEVRVGQRTGDAS